LLYNYLTAADVFPTLASPDSSLKKNTAFIKRVRTAIASNITASCLQEIRSLSLHRYLSELISACYEGLCRLKTPADVSAGVEIMSALHQRFGPTEFTIHLGWYLGKGLVTPDKSQLKALSQEAREKEEKERLIRHRNLLKVVTELWLVGVLKSLEDVAPPDEVAGKTKDATTLPNGKVGDKVKTKIETSSKSSNAEPFPLEVLKDLLANDRDHTSLPLVVTFVKAYSWDVLGVKSAAERGKQNTSSEGVPEVDEQGSADESIGSSDMISDPPLTDSDLQQRFRNILQRYLEGVKAHLVKDQKAIINQGRKNAEAYVKSGEVFEDRQANYEKQCKAQEKLVSNAQILCDILGSDMPDLKENESGEAAAPGAIGLVKTGEYLRGQGDGPGIWEDEEERRFYENIIDLKDRVPGILLEDSKKKKSESDIQVGKRNDAEGESKSEEEKPKAQEGSDEQSLAIANKTVGAQVDALLGRLLELQTRDGTDQIAIDFCFLNSKASRNRLVKAVQEVPKGRSDLFPLYSRLVATLGKYMPDVSGGLVSYLDEEFRSLQRRKSKDFLVQARAGNIRYLAELTKFGVVPEHVIFHCLKVALDDFSRMNIEIIANLLENCGKYLLRNPDTSPRMRSFLETLKRKRTAHHLSQQDRMLIENAMYYVDPPERSAIEQKERTPIDLYVRKLIYLDMNRRTYTRILKSIRKLHWEETEVVQILEKIFCKPGKLRYNNIHYLAILLQALYRYHQSFVITVLDTLLEFVTLGLEQNEFKFNQRRIAEVKYLAELYNYKLLDSGVIFDTLYRIVTFGHANGIPNPNQINPLDLPDNFFRIRLVCTILETCGSCFERGPAKKKLDFFLTFFQV
jgi:regulator of nonsense transcripts 2